MRRPTRFIPSQRTILPVKPSKLSELRIDPQHKRRPRGTVITIFVVVACVIVAAATTVYVRQGGERRVKGPSGESSSQGDSLVPASAPSKTSASSAAAASPAPSSAGKAQALVPDPAVLLTVSGYIINRERIEVSPRMQGVVDWIGVRKGDRVTKGQIVVRLEDAEQRARIAQAEAGVTLAKVALSRAQITHGRISVLRQKEAVAEDALDESRLAVDSAKAALAEVEAQLQLARTYLDWTVIRSPVDGLVLEKLVEPGELVVPMSFGGPRGPSTALLAVADPSDLQVELDIGEADLAKVRRGGSCLVTPEAYPDKHYEGVVAEIAPEANRQKGTLQVKVQVLAPDAYLTPELTARVDFLPETRKVR